MGTYPPRECGIATFNQDLLTSSQKFLGTDVCCKVAAYNLSPLDSYAYPPEVEWKIDQNSTQDQMAFAHQLNEDPRITGVMIQHEYGIYGGEEGENILSFITHCYKPMLVTLHTVLPEPSQKMRQITEKIIAYANSVVVLTKTSKEILERVYPLSVGKVYVIPHGVHQTSFSSPAKAKRKLKLEKFTILLTFGLLSRGKGIEYMIRALPAIVEKYPKVLYLILGETHPVVRRNEGERYRIELSQLVTELELKKHVLFYDQYLSLTDLIQFLKATDIYISTSINQNQAVSGTLSYAMGTGRAVVSTDFVQAKEIITPETGRLVPIQNSNAFSETLISLLGDENELTHMHRNAYELTRPMLWSNVAEDYSKLLALSVLPSINLKHLRDMTDDFGLFQFAVLHTPHKDFGYTLDDNARALAVCSWLLQSGYSSFEVNKLITIYLNFIKKCQLPDGTFINYIRHDDKMSTYQNSEEDLEDASARALWALSVVLTNNFVSQIHRDQAKEMFELAWKHTSQFVHLRAKAFTIKSFSLVLDIFTEHKIDFLNSIRENADILVKALKENSFKSWYWFDDYLGYNNAVLPESLLIAGSVLHTDEYLRRGRLALKFLIGKTFTSTMYLPIGNSHWYMMNKRRSDFDQQPEDPSSMILTLLTAFKLSHSENYRKLAETCFSWFLGNNSLHLPLYNYETGGCHDGLHPDRVNLNQGAESLVSYLLARLAMSELHAYEDSTN